MPHIHLCYHRHSLNKNAPLHASTQFSMHSHSFVLLHTLAYLYIPLRAKLCIYDYFVQLHAFVLFNMHSYLFVLSHTFVLFHVPFHASMCIRL